MSIVCKTNYEVVEAVKSRQSFTFTGENLDLGSYFQRGMIEGDEEVKFLVEQLQQHSTSIKKLDLSEFVTSSQLTFQIIVMLVMNVSECDL